MQPKNSLYSIFFTVFFVQLLNFSTHAQLPIEESDDKYFNECQYNEIVIENFYYKNQDYAVDCNDNYHHYNTQAVSKYYKEGNEDKIKISNFNVWHPGKANTRFKDYTIVASIMNRFDVVSAIELLPVIGDEAEINSRLVKKAKEHYLKINELTLAYDNEENIKDKVLLKRDIYTQKFALRRTVNAYRKPGYIKILEALKKFDASWALMLSPSGEAAKSSDVHELTGFYYRARHVKPVQNDYCKEFSPKGSSEACYPLMSQIDMGKEANLAFSRRPYMASFKASSFDFTILGSHVVFNSPSNSEKKAQILNTAFGKNSIKEIENSKGMDSTTYARFAEVKLTMEFMDLLKSKYDEKDIIFTGDFNIESSNNFMQEIISKTDYEILVDEKTSVAERRFDGLNETNGHVSNYDHFIINPEDVDECDTNTAKRFNFFTDRYVLKRMRDNYLIREDNSESKILYRYNEDAQNIIDKKSKEVAQALHAEYKILRGKFEKRYTDEQIDALIFEFQNRVFGTQLSNYSYNRVYKEVISDHAPVSIECDI